MERFPVMPRIETPAGLVTYALDGPENADVLVVLGHGAGAGMASEFMVAMASGLASAGARVCRFNFVYMERGRKPPDRQPVLEETFRSVAEEVGGIHPGLHLVLGGKSMGGRIASHLVASGTRADALVFLGYPLHPPGRPDRIRAAHLAEVDVPMLFVEGTRDPFCPLDTLDEVRRGLRTRTDVLVIEDGDHSFKVRKSSGRTTAQAWDEAIRGVASWLGERLGR